MYCSHCGAQIPDDSAFCPSCGQKPGRAGQPAAQTPAPQTAPPPQASYAQPASRYVETIQTEAEFIRDYRSLHHYETYKTLGIACRIIDIASFIIILIILISDVSSHPIATKYFGEYFLKEIIGKYVLMILIIGVPLAIGATVFQKKADTIDQEARNGYHNYKKRMGIQGSIRNSSSIFSDSNGQNLGYSSKAAPPRIYIPQNSWKCPACGRINANYVGTCACGRRKNS